MANPTPGPWRNAYQPSTGFGCGYGKSQIIAATGQAIAGVAAVEPQSGPMYRNGELSRETFDELEANARLIAAAPDLLAACQEAQGWFRQFGYNRFGISVRDDNPDHAPVLDALVAVIAKAEQGVKP